MVEVPCETLQPSSGPQCLQPVEKEPSARPERMSLAAKLIHRIRHHHAIAASCIWPDEYDALTQVDGSAKYLWELQRHPGHIYWLSLRLPRGLR